MRNAARLHATVTASDSTVLQNVKAVVCLTPGTCQIEDVGGTIIGYPLTAGQTVEVSAVKIRAASTGTYAVLRGG